MPRVTSRSRFPRGAGGVSPAPFDSLNLGRSTLDEPDHVAENRARLLAVLGSTPDRLATAGQVHGARVTHVTAPGHHAECDALLTTVPGLANSDLVRAQRRSRGQRRADQMGTANQAGQRLGTRGNAAEPGPHRYRLSNQLDQRALQLGLPVVSTGGRRLMPLPDINLDDRTFEALFQELKRRIPTYTPEWTDFNDSDPGITLLQLFAWLAEIIVYRLNKVPQKNFIKFLELVGIPLDKPAPAVTELQFTLVKGAPATPVQAGTQVALGGASSGPPVVSRRIPLFWLPDSIWFRFRALTVRSSPTARRQILRTRLLAIRL